MYLEDDSTWGFKRIYHGITFQELLIVISLMHEMDTTSLMSKMGKECSFSIDTELESAQGFDDIVVWHEQNKDIVHKFIQVKHNQDGTKKISVSSLLTKSGKFSILKLFLAYLKIKNSAKFSDGIKHFLFATNMDLDSPYSIQHEVRNLRAMLSGENKGKELSFVRIDTKDEFLDIGDSARYRISDSDGSVAQYLKQNMDFIKREIGKEVSNKEIEDFLNELVFVVNLPHEAQLRELLLGKLSSRLNKKFDYIGDNQIFCNNLLKKISDWVKDIKARPLSYKEGEELFREVEELPSTLSEMRESLDEISNSLKANEKTTKDIWEQLCAHGKLPNNKQRPHKKSYASRGKKSKAREEGDIEELDEFGEVKALEFAKKALNIENNLQNKGIKKLAQELQYSQLALKLAVTYISEENIVSSRRGRKGIRVGGYLKKCERIAEKLLNFESEYKSDRFTKATFIAWKITIDAIVQKKLGPEALSILEVIAYFPPNEIYIEEIFSQQVVNDKEALWNSVELLDRYSMIDLKRGVANVYRLVQKVTRLKLQKEGREEEVLRKALELVNSYDVLIDNSIVASVWEYASKYGELIDEFYFNPIYGRWKYTPLHSLAENGSYEAVRYILTYMEEKHPDKFNCVVNARDGSDSTPLYSSVASRKLDIVQYLINKGTDVNAKSKNGITPLHQAVYDGRVDIVEYLIGKGADVNAKDKGGYTLLHWATMTYRVDVAKVLVKHNADVNAKDKDGNTALHLAVIRQKVDITRTLLKHNADVNAKNNEGKTALDCAAECNHQELVGLLLAHGASYD